LIPYENGNKGDYGDIPEGFLTQRGRDERENKAGRHRIN